MSHERSILIDVPSSVRQRTVQGIRKAKRRRRFLQAACLAAGLTIVGFSSLLETVPEQSSQSMVVGMYYDEQFYTVAKRITDPDWQQLKGKRIGVTDDVLTDTKLEQDTSDFASNLDAFTVYQVKNDPVSEHVLVVGEEEGRERVMILSPTQ
ncbi:hypothetical protein RCC94_04820 [Exiguobacterium acetylicum]|uniref:hypothetical protein n=1 Tax=Exiguobacterium acetylicum TaxID=41170 RepID=UPI0027E0BDD6|nr:hypothetical protein [Exiguobacterium acetylicum]MDQ6466797.1 hypothetical protein [Exiguobacterium acetylicum]